MGLASGRCMLTVGGGFGLFIDWRPVLETGLLCAGARPGKEPLTQDISTVSADE